MYELYQKKDPPGLLSINIMAGDEGFEPPITGPEPGALPLGQSPTNQCILAKNNPNYQICHVYFIDQYSFRC